MLLKTHFSQDSTWFFWKWLLEVVSNTSLIHFHCYVIQQAFWYTFFRLTLKFLWKNGHWYTVKFLFSWNEVSCLISSQATPASFFSSLERRLSPSRRVVVNVFSSLTCRGRCFGEQSLPSETLLLLSGCLNITIWTSLSALLLFFFCFLTRFLPLALLTGWDEWSPLWFHWLTGSQLISSFIYLECSASFVAHGKLNHCYPANWICICIHSMFKIINIFHCCFFFKFYPEHNRPVLFYLNVIWWRFQVFCFLLQS